MPYVFSDSFGGVANQRLATDQMNIGIQREDAARRDAALQQQRAEWLAAQQQAAKYAQDQQQNTFNFGVQQQTRADQLAQNAATAATGAYQFNAGQKFSADENAANRKANLDAITARNTQQENGADYNEAFQQVNNGTVRDPAQFKILFPKLSDTEIGKLTAYSLGRNKVEADNYDALLAAANEATGFVKTKNPGTPAVPAAHFWNSDKAAILPSQLDEDAAFALATNHRVVARNLDKLAWDAVSQRFVPAIAPPTGYVPPGKRNLPPQIPPPGTATVMPGTSTPVPPTSGTGNTGWTPPPLPVGTPPVSPAFSMGNSGFSFPPGLEPSPPINLATFRSNVAAPVLPGSRGTTVAPGPVPGQRVRQNGVVYQFDGTNWMPTR